MNLRRPLVSVLLPVRDGAETLGAALDSLAAQTLTDHEVIVVDDGSRDGSADIVAAYATRDDRVRLLQTPPRGLVAALNAGLAAVRSPLVARMDADDLCLPERLALQRRWLQRRRDLVAVGSLVESFGEGVETEGWHRYIRWLNGRRTAREIARDLLVESPLVHPSVTLRTGALRDLGGYRDFDGPEDYDLWLRLARAGGRFAKVPRVLLRWRDHAGRLTRRDGRYRPAAFLRCKVDHLLAGPLHGSDRPVVIWGAGRDGGRLGRELMARGRAPMAFVDVDPRRVGRTRHGAPIITPERLATMTPKPWVLTAVGVPGARARIRRALTRRGFVEGTDYICCA